MIPEGNHPEEEEEEEGGGGGWRGKEEEKFPQAQVAEGSVFDKGLLDFFVKQNLTRCRRRPSPGKKIPLGAERGSIEPPPPPPLLILVWEAGSPRH